MRPSFHPRLFNGPLGDPGLFIPFSFERRALIFDLGDLHSLPPRDILKISHVFVTHTHMDHFIGFDRLLRLFLGREKTLYIYGPEGFIDNVAGKLNAYTWNLVDNFKHEFVLVVSEVNATQVSTRVYACRQGFHPARKKVAKNETGHLVREPALTISAIELDHAVPCLGFSIEERYHVNIVKDRVASLGLEIGPWLNRFKESLFNARDLDSEFKVWAEGPEQKARRFVLGDLAKQIALITPGQKVTYIADVAYTKANSRKITAFAKDSDHLYIEAAFLEKDRDLAARKFHLTAWQAGRIAGEAKAKQMTPFHFSPRYTGQEHLLVQEAQTAFHKYRA